jgi:hypothetical protein
MQHAPQHDTLNLRGAELWKQNNQDTGFKK